MSLGKGFKALVPRDLESYISVAATALLSAVR